jgi:hypothetical protein
MPVHRIFSFVILILLFSGIRQVRGEDYVRLKNGETVTCAILRQDTSAIYTTGWETRNLALPPLQVYTRDEVESIWFEKPLLSAKPLPYRPRPSQIEGGGSLSLQTSAETNQYRRYLGVMSFFGGFTVTREFGIEAEADITEPFGKQVDTAWTHQTTAYQVIMNAVVHPVVWKGLVPYAVVGGGAALGAPDENVILTESHDIRAVFDFGLGVKWGGNGIGYSIEWRHHYYSWTPDRVANDIRVPAQTADLSVIRASLFIYR